MPRLRTTSCGWGRSSSHAASSSSAAVDSRSWRAVSDSPATCTKTDKGLDVYARLDQNEYPKVEVTNTQLAAVNITRDEFHPEWNYSIEPSTQ